MESHIVGLDALWNFTCGQDRPDICNHTNDVLQIMLYLPKYVWENVPSNFSTKSHIQFGGLETNHKYMNIIISQKLI